jgi:hypothetical protein
MNRTGKPEEAKGAKRPAPQTFRTNRAAARARSAEPNRTDHAPSRAASPARHHEPARHE